MAYSSILLCEKLREKELLLSTTSHKSVSIRGITNDSRKVKDQFLFTAILGEKNDGHHYLPHVVAQGASVIIYTQEDVNLPEHVLGLKVSDSYYAHAIACELFYNTPISQLKVAAVTGTNGKTTTAFLLNHLTNMLAPNVNIGLLSTVCSNTGLGKTPSERTTPDAEEIQSLFAEMVENKCEYAIMEYSSHGLHQHRTGSQLLATAIFTNLTGDHLDYHKDMQSYFEAKKILFTDYLAKDATVFINIDDPYGLKLAQMVNCKVITFGKNERATWVIQGIHSSLSGTRFELKTPEQIYALTTPHIGEHNVYNLVSAIGGAHGLGFELESVIEATHKLPLPPVPGRLESILLRNGVNVFVDYAHTDDALEHALSSLHGLTLCKSRVIVLFGCGGNRDKTKRPRMGAIAAQWADVIWVTSDNPRDEDPEDIIDQIMVGIPTDSTCKVVRKADRKMAIRLALMDAREGDALLIAGKGHETYQEIKGVKTPFDDRKMVREIASLLGID